MARKKNTPPQLMEENRAEEQRETTEQIPSQAPEQTSAQARHRPPAQGADPASEGDQDAPMECPADLTEEKQLPAEPAEPAPPTLTQRIDRASHILMDKFDESLSQLNRRAVQIKCHVVLEDKSTRDEITTRYEEDERVDLEAMDRLADTLKTIRQSAALKLPGEDAVRALPLLGLSDEEKEAYCK